MYTQCEKCGRAGWHHECHSLPYGWRQTEGGNLICAACWAPIRRALQRQKNSTIPVGPFCWLRQNRHPGPFSKRKSGYLRRTARRFKLQLQQEALQP